MGGLRAVVRTDIAQLAVMLGATLAFAIWAVLAAIILSGVITVEDLDWMGVLGERIPN